MFTIDPLIHVLEELTYIHQEIQQLADKKREVLISGDIHELSSIVQKESRLVRELGRLETDRQMVVAQLAKELHPDKEELSLTDIIQAVHSEKDKERLLQIHQNLKSLITDLQAKNKTNQELIQQSLDYVNYTLELFTSPLEQEPFYSKPEKPSNSPFESKQRSFFDAKA